MLADIRERSRSESGFTLIELLVVMIIIAILMAVAVPTFLAQKNNAQKSKATSNIKQIVNAIESCAANNTDGSYKSSNGTDCTSPANLLTVEKSLNSLNPALTTGNPVVNGYTVDPINTQGYIVRAAIQDGDYSVTFAEIHKEDGNLLKICSATKGTTPPSIAATATAGVKALDSRTCTSGTWG